MASLVERFAARFAGLPRVHGRYIVPSGAKPDADGKVTGKRWTAREPYTVEDLEAHLSGRPVAVRDGEGTVTGALGIGVVPIRDDATCVFGAIDVDVYPLDVPALAAEARRLKLPLIPCRSKSGGAHLYLFLSSPATAALVRGKLMEWAVALGYPNAEVFPFHTRLASDQDSSFWINLPYSNAERTLRYAIGPDGRALALEGFLDLADGTAVSPEELAAIEPPVGDEPFADGPPCLQTLAKAGFGDWQNNALFNMSVYLKKKHGEGWSERVAEVNERFLSPPVPSKDALSTIKSVAKKGYSYMCKAEPICAVCNRAVCLTRPFGVRGSTGDSGVTFGPMTKLLTQPPSWIWEVNGARIELDTAAILDQRKFHYAVAETLNIWPDFVRAEKWQELVREKLASVIEIEVPEDATKKGQLWVQLQRFCTSKLRTDKADEVLLGRPYDDAKAGRTWFAGADFMQYLQQHRFGNVAEKEVWRWLREKGAGHEFKKVKGKGINLWWVPTFPEQAEEHPAPRLPKEEPF